MKKPKLKLVSTKLPADSIHETGFPKLGFIPILCLKFRALDVFIGSSIHETSYIILSKNVALYSNKHNLIINKYTLYIYL